MISFTDWNKKKEKNTDYKIVKSRSGLPMFVLEPPESLNDLPTDDENLKKSIPQMVSDFISSKSH